MLQASRGRSGKQQQEQTSPNHVQELFPGSVQRLYKLRHVSKLPKFTRDRFGANAQILLKCTPRITLNTASISHLNSSGGSGLEQDGDDVGVGGFGGGGEVQRRVAVQVHGVDGSTFIHQQLDNLQKGLAKPIIFRVNVNKHT